LKNRLCARRSKRHTRRAPPAIAPARSGAWCAVQVRSGLCLRGGRRAREPDSSKRQQVHSLPLSLSPSLPLSLSVACQSGGREAAQGLHLRYPISRLASIPAAIGKSGKRDLCSSRCVAWTLPSSGRPATPLCPRYLEPTMSTLSQRWGKQGNRARVLFPFPGTARLCFRRRHVLDWALEGTADHPLCTLSWELGGVLATLLTNHLCNRAPG